MAAAFFNQWKLIIVLVLEIGLLDKKEPKAGHYMQVDDEQ